MFLKPVQQIVDAADRTAVGELLSGNIWQATCPVCSFRSRVPTPILYHDASAHLALVLLAQSSSASQADSERAVGQLTNRVIDSLPPADRGMYLLQPKLYLNEESFVAAVRESLPSTPRAAAERPARVAVKFEDVLSELRKAEREGRLDEAVAAIRPAIDYGFYATLTRSIETAGQSAESTELTALRSKILDACDRADGAAREAVAGATEALTRILGAPDVAAAVAREADSIDAVFLLVLEANRTAALADGSSDVLARLDAILESAVPIYESRLSPLERLIGRLARITDADERRALVERDKAALEPGFAGALRAASRDARERGADVVADNLDQALAVLDASHAADLGER